MNKYRNETNSLNPFLRFFKILSLNAQRMPSKKKGVPVAACAVFISLGIMFSAIAVPQLYAAPKQEIIEIQPEADSKKASHMIKGIPIVVQDYYKAGCETYACTMLLQGLGFDIDEHKFVDNYLILRDMSWDENGTMYGPDMDSAFAGDIFTGHGINCPAMAKSINGYLKTQKTDKKAYFSKEMSLEQLCEEYIDNDIPVMTWVTCYMEESYERFSWVINYVDENSKHKVGDEIAIASTTPTIIKCFMAVLSLLSLFQTPIFYLLPCRTLLCARYGYAA